MAGGRNIEMNIKTADSQIGFDIETLINECQPSSILVIGANEKTYIANYIAQKKALHQQCTVTSISIKDALPYRQKPLRYDVGIVVDTLEYLDKEQSGQLIARLRDLHTDRFVIVVRIGDQWEHIKSIWQTVDLLGFGMKLVSRYHIDNKPIHVYKYDISTYKKTPEWLNAKNWANPELWSRFRW